MLYNLIVLMLSPLVAVYLTQRYLSGKSKPGWSQRWGYLPTDLQWKPGGRPRLWIHAVSAGEVTAAVPILRELRERLPDHELLLSVMTQAGNDIAGQQAAKYVDGIFYFPFDLPWVARHVVRWIRPQVYVSLESEMWPNVLHELKRVGAKTVMVNGRISDKNFRRAAGVGGLLFRWMLSNMDRLLMQSAADAERIRALGGGLTEPGRVAVIGNSKFDQEIKRLTPDEVLALRRDLGLPDEVPVFVAGSTRSAEEEAQVILAYLKMRESVPELCLLVAPRKIERAEELAAAMQAAGLSPVRRSQRMVNAAEHNTTGKEAAPDTVRHLILDTFGELANVYAVATITYIGNTINPVVQGGGQNLLQPLAHGKPVLFGPRIATIRSEVALVLEANVGFQIEDGVELAEVAVRLLEDSEACREIEARALDLIAANQGVSARYAAAVAEMAPIPPPFKEVRSDAHSGSGLRSS